MLSHSDGARGILWVRGHTLPELVARFGYDGAVGLLWEGFAGDGLDRDDDARRGSAPAGMGPSPGSATGCRRRASGR